MVRYPTEALLSGKLGKVIVICFDLTTFGSICPHKSTLLTDVSRR